MEDIMGMPMYASVPAGENRYYAVLLIMPSGMWSAMFQGFSPAWLPAMRTLVVTLPVSRERRGRAGNRPAFLSTRETSILLALFVSSRPEAETRPPSAA